MEPYLDRIRKKTTQAIATFGLITNGDRVMVCVSGGKDSAILALILKDIQKRAPFHFEITCVLLDQKQPGFDGKAFENWLGEQGLPLTIIDEDTYSIVKEKVEPGKSFCGLCSRLRRGIFYNYAHQHGYHKIALGHHREDLNETLLLNLFYSGRLSSMPPLLHSDDGRNTVIRPFSLVPEAWLAQAASDLNIPVIPCNLCGSQENLRRKRIKSWLAELSQKDEAIAASILTAQQNIRPSQLMDPQFSNFPTVDDSFA